VEEAVSGNLKEKPQSKLLPEDSKIQNELSNFSLPEKIINVLMNERNKPEGKVRIDWIKKIIKHYGYPGSQIDINVAAGVGRDAGKRNTPVRADIVVYRDTLKTKPIIVIETKSPNQKEGIEQAESYSRNLGAEYHLWSDGLTELTYKTARYANQSEPIGRLPTWVSDKPLAKKVPKSEYLRPFKDEEELRQVVGYCHDLILEKLGHDPAKAFDEMTKLLFIKLYDEREVPSFYEFVVLANEDAEIVAKRIKELFAKAVSSSKYQDVFSSRFNEKQSVTLELDDFSIFKIVQVLQGYSLVNTTENIQGADIKGTVYEQMVGTTFRGELAQFFTPREIVDFVVDIVKPTREEVVLDPACGSGGFLIMVLGKLKEAIQKENPNLSDADLKAAVKYIAEHHIFGTDINDRMVRVSKMNMIMHGDGHSGIFYTNGLLTDPDVPKVLVEKIKKKSVNVILSNPPFAGLEKDPEILRMFNLGKNDNSKTRSVSKEVLFVEMIVDLLAVNGRAGLVLPSGVFNNPNQVMKDLRKYIKKHTKIVALIGLPHLAFQITGANNEGNLLFLEKVKDVPKDYPIYIDWAHYVGFNTTGKKISQNDLNDIKERMKNPPPENQIMFSELEDRIDPWYYHPKYKEIRTTIEKTNYPLKPISEVFKKSDSMFKPKQHLDETFNYLETSDVDLETGTFISSQLITGRTAPNRAKYVLKEGDFLIPNARDCIRGVAVVDKEHAGYICTSRFFVLRPDTTQVVSKYLFYVLRQPEILALLKQQATGEINPGITCSKQVNSLENVKIPVPDKDVQLDIVNKIVEKEEKKNKLLREIETYDQEICLLARDKIPILELKKEKLSKLGYDYIGDL